MKLTTEPRSLAAAVKFAARALPARPVYPVLAGLKITVDSGSLEVSGYDQDSTSARARIDADTGEPGTVVVPGRLLADITARLPRQPAELSADDRALTLACGSLRYRLRLLPAGQYPALPQLPGPAGHADPGEFAAAVAQVTPAAGRDDTLTLLTAVHVAFAPDAVSLTATDRYRAAFRRLPWQPAGDTGGGLPPPVLIPAAALAGAGRQGGTGPVSIHIATAADETPVTAGFGRDRQSLTTGLLHGGYPDIASKIPPASSTAATVATAELAGAVKRLAAVAARDLPVRLTFEPGRIELTAGSDDEAGGCDTVACELDGDPVTAAFCPRRLLDAVTAAGGTGRVRIALTTPRRPALFTPADGDADETVPGYQHILMPIRPA